MQLRDAAVYLAANVVSAAMGFAGAVVFTRLFTPADYGVSVVAGSIGGVLSATLYTWVRLSVLRLQAAGDDADIRATALWSYAGSSALLLAVVPGLIFIGGLPWREALGAGLFALTIAFFEMQLEMLRAKREVWRYASGVGLRAVAYIGLGVVFWRLGLGGFGLVLALALAYVAASLLLAPRAWRLPLKPFDRAAFRSMLLFGLPATLSGLLLALHSASDRLIVSWMLGPSVGGQYGVAADFTRQIILVPAMALGSAVAPVAIRTLAVSGREAARRHLAQSADIMFALLLPAVTGVALVAGEIAGLVMGPSFREAAALLIPVLAFVWLFQAMSQNYIHISYHMAAHGRGMLYQGLVSVIANVSLILPLTWAYGIHGTAVAVVAGEAIGFAAGYWFSRAAFPLPFVWRGWLRAIAADLVMVAAVLLAARLLPADAPVLALATKAAVGIASYGAAVLALDVAGARELLRGRLVRPAAART